MASNRTSVIDFRTGLSPIGDHRFRPPMVWPAVKRSEMTAAIRSQSVVVTPRILRNVVGDPNDFLA